MTPKKNCGTCGRLFARRERRVWFNFKQHCLQCRPLDNPATLVQSATSGPPQNPNPIILTTDKVGDDVIIRLGFLDAIQADSRPKKKPKTKTAEWAKPANVLISKINNQATMEVLQQCARNLTLACISYQKPAEGWSTERTIEPYRLTHTSQNFIIETWQVSPPLETPAWRSFRLDRIMAVRATTAKFSPREEVTIHHGEVSRFQFGSKQGSDTEKPCSRQLYTECLKKALDDYDLTTDEIQVLRSIRGNLDEQEIRAVHGRVYGDVLADFCGDGRVSDDEIEKLTAMRIWLTELGWSP